ncbi:MAG TPA: ABC transporter substrate-binding protein [Longimicrobium sp.]
MKRKTGWIIGAAVLAAVLVLGILLARRPTSSGGPEIRVGAVLPLTGPVSFLGESEQRGMQLAVAEINANGGILGRRLEIVFEDSRGQPADGAAAAQKLISTSGASFLITSMTGVSLAVKPIVAERAGVLQFVFAMDESIPANADNVFRIYPGIHEEGDMLLAHASTLKPKKVAIIFQENPAFQRLAQEVLTPGLRQMGATSVAAESFTGDDFAMIRNVMVRVRSMQPELIILIGYYNNMPALLRAVDESGLRQTSRILGVHDVAMAADRGQLTPALLEGVVVAVPSYTLNQQVSPVTHSFITAYRARFGGMPNYDAAFGYTTMKLLADAITRAGTTDPEQVQRTLRSFSQVETASGKISIGPDGNSRSTWVLARFQNGRLVAALDSAVANPPAAGSGER